MPHISLNTPIGTLTVFEDNNAIVAVDWGRAPEPEETPLLKAAKDQLHAYFGRKLRDFDLPLRPAGSEFDKAVWDVMCEIPYGRTLTYGEVAARIGGIARAVGGACGRNPIPIIIPCHRVTAAHGRPGGYSGAGGLATKRALLHLEGAPEQLELT